MSHDQEHRLEEIFSAARQMPPQERMEEWKLSKDAREIQRLYQRVGQPLPSVKSVPNIEERTGRARVPFEIMEGPK